METDIQIANFLLVQDDISLDTFYGEMEINESLATILPNLKRFKQKYSYHPEHLEKIYLYGKAYDFEGNKKSFIKLKFFNDNELYGVGGNGEYDAWYDERDYYDLDVNFDDINRDEVGEGKIFLENSKFSSKSPDFHGTCILNDNVYSEATLKKDFNIAGWYNKKILDDSIKINLKISYKEKKLDDEVLAF